MLKNRIREPVFMPQLDKYIFVNQIIYLSIFFFLIYFYIRGTVIPQVSSLLKYRKKKINSLNNQLQEYTKFKNFVKSVFDKKGKNFILYLTNSIYNFNFFYYKSVLKQFKNIYNTFFSNIFVNLKLCYFLIANKIEYKRLETI